MAITREFKQDEDLYEAILDGKTIERQEWRHGHKALKLFEHDGAHWATWVEVHHSEGIELYWPVKATKMVEKQVTATKWVPADDDVDRPSHDRGKP